MHPLHADFQAMQGASEAHPTKWKSSTGAGQQCDGIQYLPQHATEHLRVNKPPQPLAAPIGFGLSGPIRVAANNDGPGKDKKLPPPLPDVHITLSQDWLSAAPQGGRPCCDDSALTGMQYGNAQMRAMLQLAPARLSQLKLLLLLSRGT